MAVYTEVPDSIAEVFVSGYDIGNFRKLKGICEGVENSNFHLWTDQGRYILTLFERRVDCDDLPFFLGLLGHLRRGGTVCPETLADRQGHFYSRICDRYAAITTFLYGRPLGHWQVGHARQVGHMLAGLHQGGATYPSARPNALCVDSWGSLLEQIGRLANLRDHSTPIPDFGDLTMGAIADMIESLEAVWPRDLPSGICHADCFPDNVFWLGDRLTGVIDFYFSCTEQWAYDVAIMLNAWSFTPRSEMRSDIFDGMLAGYEEVRALGAEERLALPVLLRGAALRFFLTRLYDWFATAEGSLVNKKDPMEYWRILQFYSRSSWGVDGDRVTKRNSGGNLAQPGGMK